MKVKKLIILGVAVLTLVMLIIFVQLKLIFPSPITSLVKNIFSSQKNDIPKVFRQLAQYGISYENQILLIRDLINYYNSIPVEKKERIENLLLEYFSHAKQENYIRAMKENNSREMNRIAISHITRELQIELLPILNDVQKIIDSYTSKRKENIGNRNPLNCIYSAAIAASFVENQNDSINGNRESGSSSNTTSNNISSNTTTNTSSDTTKPGDDDNRREEPLIPLPTTTKPGEKGRRLPPPFDDWRREPPSSATPFPKDGGRLVNDRLDIVIDYGKGLANGYGFIVKKKGGTIGLGLKNSDPENKKIKPIPIIGGGQEGKEKGLTSGFIGHDLTCRWIGGFTIRF